MSIGGPPAQPDVHLTPDLGLQTYPEPYPAFRAPKGPVLAGRVVVQVVAAQGPWVQVAADGAIVGWVDGRSLLPPVGAPGAQPLPMTPRETHHAIVTPTAPPAGAQLTVEAVVGAIVSLGIVIGALIDWTQGLGSVTAFKVPIAFLFDSRSTAHDPKLGYLLLLVGVLGLLTSFFTAARPLRVLLGMLALAGAALYCIQISNSLPDGSPISWSDLVGAGPWVAGSAGLVLSFSPLVKQR